MCVKNNYPAIKPFGRRSEGVWREVVVLVQTPYASEGLLYSTRMCMGVRACSVQIKQCVCVSSRMWHHHLLCTPRPRPVPPSRPPRAILELPKRGARSAGAVELEAAHDLPHNWLLPGPAPSPPLSSRVAGGGGGGAVGGPRGGRGPLSALAGA